MKLFKRRQFRSDIILLSLRWYTKYPLSYRNLEEMLEERGVSVDHSTINRWVIFYAPKMLKKLKKHCNHTFSTTWHLDETYVKIKGCWNYLYRAINKRGETIDFYLSKSRDKNAAVAFLKKGVKSFKRSMLPLTINTDKHASYGKAIKSLKKSKELPKELVHRSVKYLNNRIESDHGKLKRLIKPTLGFKSFYSAKATIEGFELMRMFKKGQFIGVCNVRDQIRLISRVMNAC